MFNNSKPHAIIYIPGLNHTGEKGSSIDAFAYRIKKAIDINHSEGKYKFGLHIQKKSYGKDNKQECSVASIYREDKTERVEVCHIYELDYSKELAEKLDNQNVLVKTILLFNAIVSKFPRLFWVLFHRGIKGLSDKDKVQIFFTAFILFCLSAYGVLLVSAIISAVGSKFHMVPLEPLTLMHIEPPPVNMPQWVSDMLDYLLPFFLWIKHFIGGVAHNSLSILGRYKKYILGSSAFILLLLPNFKNFVTKIATDYLCLINYFNIGERRLTIVGKLEELLENVEECDTEYSHIAIYSYSFGSIISLDTLFPYDGKPSLRIRKNIKTLVTIGCPFDFIRVYWPDYYSKRKVSQIELEKWYNIHSGLDVLSSNFRNDPVEGEATKGITEGNLLPTNISFNLVNPDNVGVKDMILLLGLRAHGMYWDETEYSASCFTNLFEQMKQDERRKEKKSLTDNSKTVNQ